MKQIYFFTIFLLIKSSILLSQTSDVISEINRPGSIAFHGNELYIALPFEDKIIKIDITETTPTLTDVVTDLHYPWSITFIENELYIGQYGRVTYEGGEFGGGTVVGNGKISKIDITETEPTLIDVYTESNLNVESITSIENNLYFTADVPNNSQIYKIDITESTPTVTTENIEGIWPNNVATFGNELYFDYADNDGYKISKIDNTAASTSFINLISDLERNNFIAFHGNELYISEWSAGKISKAELSTLSLNSTNIHNLNIFPNPASNFITISGINEPIRFSLYNNLGIKIKSNMISQSKNKINIQNLTKGLFFLKLENGIVFKFIKK